MSVSVSFKTLDEKLVPGGLATYQRAILSGCLPMIPWAAPIVLGSTAPDQKLSSMRAIEPRTFDKTIAEDENGIQYEFYPPEDYNNELCAII